jgi:TolB protein
MIVSGGSLVAKLYLRIAPCLMIAWAACSPPSGRMGNYRIALVPARSGQHGIFVMNSDTTGGKLLTPDPSAQLRASSWSPDGKRIAFFCARRADSDILTKYRTPFHYPLYVMDATGGNQKRLLDFPVSSFEWSPDSQQLLFVSAYEDPDHDDPAVLRGIKAPMSAIYVLSLPTGEQKRLTSFGQNCSGTWSPDGSSVALSFGNEQKSDIYTARLDGKQTRRLTESQAINLRPVWSPNGKAIAYVSVAPPGAEDVDAGVYVIDAAGAGKRRVSDMIAFEASWSPDGMWLLLQSAAGLALTDADGKKTMNLIPGIGRPLDAVFTPDGQKVIFRSNHEGDWYLFTVDLTGGNLKRTTGKLSASTFCLSPLLSRR